MWTLGAVAWRLLALAALAGLCLGVLPRAVAHPLAQRVLNTEPNRHLQQLAYVSDLEDGIARTYFSPAHHMAAEQIRSWMEDAGMASWIDAVGNVHGYAGAWDGSAPEILVGSHYDTVVDGGAYDGALGIIAGIAAVKWNILAAIEKKQARPLNTSGLGALEDLKIDATEARALLRHPIHVIAFADEEGIRFKSTFLGSRAVAGTLLKHNGLAAVDADGITLERAMRLNGATDLLEELERIAMKPSMLKSYVEVHIEQGPVLEATGQPLGVVSAIAGQTRLQVTISGEQGHAGTVPMRGRRDAMAAAAEVIGIIERRCGGGPTPPQGEDVFEVPADDMLVCTVGELRATPNIVNVIAGSATLTVDVRARIDDLRTSVVAGLNQSLLAACAARSVACSVKETHSAAAVQSDPAIIAGLVKAVQRSDRLLASALGLAYAEPEKVGPGCGGVDPVRAVSAALGTAPDGGKTAANGKNNGGSAGARGGSSAGSKRVSSTEGSSASGGSGSKRSSGAVLAPTMSMLKAAAGIAPQLGTCALPEAPSVPVMVSGAGHDAMAIAEVAPMAMLFVRCRGGISHNPAEYASPADVAAATVALATYLQAEAGVGPLLD